VQDRAAERLERMTVRRFSSHAEADAYDRTYWQQMPPAERILQVWKLSREQWLLRDERTDESAAVLRAVTSQDGMTADWARLPYEVMERISSRVINEVKGINRLVYDISSKPPSTIEWE